MSNIFGGGSPDPETLRAREFHAGYIDALRARAKLSVGLYQADYDAGYDLGLYYQQFFTFIT